MPESAKDDARHLKLTVVLLLRHISALDHLAVTIRLRAGVVLSRAGIIAAFIEASRRRPRAALEAMLQKRVPVNKYRTRGPRGEGRSGKKST
ncbi:MAG TPA: hypothetical protein VLC46_14370 [Thermoanaerobaculia bacterium]|nr:hypothetical protein [Thermoanaerobaculia bacterium]